MKHSDIKNKADIRALMQKALKENDVEGFSAAFEDMMQCVGAEVKAEYEEHMEELKQSYNNAVLSARGCHLLTIEEKAYYTALAEAMKAEDPKQAVNNLDVVMPETVINRVMEDLETEHPLLNKINFIGTNGAIKVMMNTSGEEMAVWGPLWVMTGGSVTTVSTGSLLLQPHSITAASTGSKNFLKENDISHSP